jgi:hypothetical protein
VAKIGFMENYAAHHVMCNDAMTRVNAMMRVNMSSDNDAREHEQ